VLEGRLVEACLSTCAVLTPRSPGFSLSRSRFSRKYAGAVAERLRAPCAASLSRRGAALFGQGPSAAERQGLGVRFRGLGFSFRCFRPMPSGPVPLSLLEPFKRVSYHSATRMQALSDKKTTWPLRKVRP
jgi:hypothetical protein